MPKCLRSEPNQALPDDVRQRIERHPCFCEEASRFYARIHLPVAPACNLQCGFCNRRFDCSNESRPGVTSQLISPEQALERVRLVYARLPHLSVVGVAGPGDPLANPERTFRTLELVKANFPELKLCLSTNGLALPEAVPAIAELGVEHVTVSVHAVDPAVGAQIYLWARAGRTKWTGIDGARRILEHQLEGIRMLAERKILVKVNVVQVPGINEQHIPEIAQIVKKSGATLLNILPLIPVKGSAMEGLRPPGLQEIAQARMLSGQHIHLIHHCRQCRADAIGLLEEDLSGSVEFVPAGHLAAQPCQKSRETL
jgi:nitrogen fixation protein NifB